MSTDSEAVKGTGFPLPRCPSSNSNPLPSSLDLWSQIVAAESPHPQRIDVVYRRRQPRNPHNHPNSNPPDAALPRPTRPSLDPNKRVSWNRSLSIRGRTSIAVGACMVYQPQLKKDKRKGKPALPKGKLVQPPNVEKEKLYFEEVDAFELLEESPSPKKNTWIIGDMVQEGPMPTICSRLEKWLHSRRLNHTYGPSSTLSKILDTSSTRLEAIQDIDFSTPEMRTLERTEKSNSLLQAIKTGDRKPSIENDIHLQTNEEMLLAQCSEGREDINAAVKKLSLASTSSIDDDHISPFSALLSICGQSAPSLLQNIFSSNLFLLAMGDLSGSKTIVKVGEGTFGEAFKVNNYVCKIVPFDGDFRVNGEIQKRSEELLEEVLLCKTLNLLRGKEGASDNLCRAFIDCIDVSSSYGPVVCDRFRVCQGPYDAALIRAWEDWDLKHGSENDHPKEFPDKQCYVVFVQEHGGKDLEGFALLNFDEARALLAQVTAGLAVAESAFEFEHRDLHWGNILVGRSDSETLQFTLDGRKMLVKTYGLIISIIDFTLSRINTGDRILYLDLSSDPDLFKGPKGDKQSETYRRMKEVTEDWWEGSCPKTNVLWLIYLVDILLTKKSFERTSKHERDLRSFKKRLDQYDSSKEAILDPFFTDLFIESDAKILQTNVHAHALISNPGKVDKWKLVILRKIKKQELTEKACFWSQPNTSQLIILRTASTPSVAPAFLHKTKISKSEIRLSVTDYMLLKTLIDTNLSVDFFLNESLVENFVSSKSSPVSSLKVHLLDILPQVDIRSIIVRCGSQCLGRDETPSLIRVLKSIHSFISNLQLGREVKVSVAFPLSFLEYLNASYENDLLRIVVFLKKIDSFIMIEDTIDGESGIVQSVIERATFAASILPCKDVPVVLTIKSRDIPCSMELAQFSESVSKYLEAGSHVTKRIVALYAEVQTTKGFVLGDLKREEGDDILPLFLREKLGQVHIRRVLQDTTNLPNTVSPTNPTPPTPVISPPDTPTIITVPSTNPVTVSPTNPGATPVTVPSTTPPVPLAPTNPANPGAQPVTNPVTSYPSPSGNGPITNTLSPPPNTNGQATGGQSWCVAKTGVSEATLQSALDYACGMQSVDCSQIQQGGSCYNPNSLQNHASFAFNSYYQKNPASTSCDFGGAATIVNTNPSSGSCIYPSSSGGGTSGSNGSPSVLGSQSPPDLNTSNSALRPFLDCMVLVVISLVSVRLTI
ncbi:unnamed protein product [Sphenostylis stenocarpa]|uniref:non-specific serine/threonine protein kinase n=1 Tax=Sphenostylis stenocarpa TaxID=92480 RepID=A0AA86RPS7_9FABA|nr:unnamed protein product [Sphenostylis stenocarpa]